MNCTPPLSPHSPIWLHKIFLYTFSVLSDVSSFFTVFLRKNALIYSIFLKLVYRWILFSGIICNLIFFLIIDSLFCFRLIVWLMVISVIHINAFPSIVHWHVVVRGICFVVVCGFLYYQFMFKKYQITHFYNNIECLCA